MTVLLVMLTAECEVIDFSCANDGSVSVETFKNKKDGKTYENLSYFSQASL